MELYREVSVWERMETGGLAHYRCLELLQGGGFCVQSVDFYQPNDNIAERGLQFSRQFIELLSEEAAETRTHALPSLKEAIEAHKREFGEAQA